MPSMVRCDAGSASSAVSLRSNAADVQPTISLATNTERAHWGGSPYCRWKIRRDSRGATLRGRSASANSRMPELNESAAAIITAPLESKRPGILVGGRRVYHTSAMVQDAEIDRNGRSRRADRRALSCTGRPLVCSAIVAASLVIYFVMTLPRLGVFPPVGEDEPWIAAAPYKLATDGVLGSDLFAGYYGMERHHYAHLPLFPLAQAAIFKLAAAGVVQMRALPVAFGALLLCAVFVVGRQAGGDRVGAIAMALMVVLRITAGGAATGILLLDRARINRYDIAVPVFGLAALWAFNRWEYTRRRLWIAIAGSLAALATLSHLCGVFWLPLLVGLLIARHGRRAHRDLIALAAGFAAPCLPWLAFIATGWTDFLGQMRMTAGRFDLLNPSFYVDNMFRGDGPISLGWAARTIASLPLTRIGTWTMLAGGAGACVAMLALTRRRDADPGKTLAIACLGQTAMFAALLKVKIVAYMIALWPLWA